MRSGIHPTYRPVVFRDQISGTAFLTRSTIATTRTIVWSDGETYPLHDAEITSDTHPFFTGKMKIVDTAGRVERFERRYGRRAAGDAESDVETDAGGVTQRPDRPDPGGER